VDFLHDIAKLPDLGSVHALFITLIPCIVIFHSYYLIVAGFSRS
jgi:hypothetical protein